MANENPTPPTDGVTRRWDSLDDQRNAGLDFLRALLADDVLRTSVVTNRKTARDKFGETGKIAIPADVEVVCVEPTTEARKKIVVLVLPEKGAQLPTDLSVLPHWIAGWTPYSSARFKRNIRRMGTASNAILSLRPVTFRYKRKLDQGAVPQFGLVAEEVEKANPDLVMRDGTGRTYGVRYDAINAMLLNEFLRQHGTVNQQGLMIAQQKRKLDKLTARIQKLSRPTRPKTKKVDT
jgi:endosialidase-like protein